MTVGRFLDDAARRLAAATDWLDSRPELDRAGLAAALYARNVLYREILRLAREIGPVLPWRDLPVADAVALLGHDGGGSADSALLVRRGLESAVLGLDRVSTELLRTPGTAAALIIDAADSVGAAAETISTHVGPGASSLARDSRFLTREGAALRCGAQRREALGEIGRLVTAAWSIDARLAAHHIAGPQVIDPRQWNELTRWVTSDFNAEFAELGTASPAGLLRQLGPAPAVERSGGPRIPFTWQDIAGTVAAVRSAIRRDPRVATTAMVRATARLGFAVTAAEWRMSGTDTPSPRSQRHGDAWRSVDTAMQRLADRNSAIGSPLAEEMDLAHRWIRDRVAEPTVAPADRDGLPAVQQQLIQLAQDLHSPLRLALANKELFVAGKALAPDSPRRGGITMSVHTWVPAEDRDQQVGWALDALQTAGQLELSTPAPAQGYQGLVIGQTVLRAAGRLAGAWPSAVGRSRSHAAGPIQPPPQRHQRSHADRGHTGQEARER